MQDDSPPSRVTRLWVAAESRGIPLRTILVTVAVIGLAYVLAKVAYRLRDVELLMLVAGFIALLLNPLVTALQNWRVRNRGLAVLIVTVLGLIVFFGLALAFGLPLTNGLAHLAHDLPSYVKQAERGKGPVGHLVRKYHIQSWVKRNVPKLLSVGQDLAKPALSLGKGAFSLLLTLLTIFVLVVLILLEAPRMRQGILSLMPEKTSAEVSKVAGQVSRSVTGYMVGNLLTSIIAGVVVLVTLMLTGVPFPFLWALWVALVDFLPMIGGALAGIPTVLFAAGHSLAAGIITLVVFLIYTQVENHVLNPVIMSRTVHVSPLLVLVSILVGASIGDWIGGIFGAFVAALLAIPFASAIQVLTKELWQITALPRDPPADQP
ncbi:MAG TPA: AI-2E family transporter [Streptosporangiaceae bacterium]|nr:AI-2E family transporter [Streptosporangiaceae bacterium]